MIFTTTETIPNKNITEILGVARGNTVRARAIGKDIMAGFKSIAGGEIHEYSNLMADSREEAFQRMAKKAEELSYPQNLRFDLEIKIKITNDQINKLQQKNSENISLEEINLLDYSTISPIIKKIFCNSKFHLLETLGTTINDAIIKQNSNKGIIIQEIKTRIQKLIPPNNIHIFRYINIQIKYII